MKCALVLREAFDRVIGPAFAAENGYAPEIDWTPTTVIMQKIAAGERVDALVLIADSMDRLVEQDLVDPATRIEVADSRVGIAVPKGAPHPDISTPEAFTDALLAARSVAYSKAGASGIYFEKMMARLGITEAINAKATVIPAGFTAEKLTTGEADLAVQQLSELLVVPGIEIVGPFPGDLQNVTHFSAAIMREARNREGAERFLAMLTQPRAIEAYRASGLDAATR
ncbi:substrate-binding domain-containing protein [Roseomonas sp. SG15]|uniref:Substrate-binding domain-containing protein n=2 Tax=Roseomonas indoligenes TaxID=2820811 RepID=A0A940N2C9_9PROT|nr:substrate-binding domain-containing protein [Pararoseomonas indoligenes]